MKRSCSSLIAVVAFTVVACGSEGPQPQVSEPARQVSPEEAANARRTIVEWFECEECESGELEAVVKLGQTAVPTLAATLRDGPSPAARETLRMHLVDSYEQLRKQTGPESKVDMSEEQYVKTYMDNYEALYRVRAAQALSAIGGADAQRALESANDYDLRDDVRAEVTEALQKMRRVQQ